MKKFDDGSFIEIGPGRIDDWCVYLTRPSKVKHAPFDKDYFSVVVDLASRHDAKTLWDAFKTIADQTNKMPDERILALIYEMSKEFGDDGLEFDIAYTCIYLGMVAEENKAGTRLGRRIKMLAMHQILVEGLSVPKAANFSKGMGWREIDALCKQRGF